MADVMDSLIFELDRLGVNHHEWVDECDAYHLKHVRFHTDGGEVSVIHGFMRTKDGAAYGISHGWPMFLEAAWIHEDESSFRCLEEPEAMTVEEIIEKYAKGANRG